jgi:hypothetical protein
MRDLGDVIVFFFLSEVRGAASNSAYCGYPKLWILRYPAHRYYAMRSPGFVPTTLQLRVGHPNHLATMFPHSATMLSFSGIPDRVKAPVNNVDCHQLLS